MPWRKSWTTQGEQQKQDICPRCGSDNISYNRISKTWRCNKCEHVFNLPNDTPVYDEGIKEDYSETEVEDKTSPKSKAWFGTEYFDKKSHKWKKPKYKKSTVIASIIALLAVIAIVVIVILYCFVFTK